MRACAFLSLGLVFEANKRVIRADGFQLSLELGKNKISPLRIPLNHIIWPQRLAVLGHSRPTAQSGGIRTRAGHDEPARNPPANERVVRGGGREPCYSCSRKLWNDQGQNQEERKSESERIKTREEIFSDSCLGWISVDLLKTHKQAVCLGQRCNLRLVSPPSLNLSSHSSDLCNNTVVPMIVSRTTP